jgi:hypothetical protein
MSDVPGGASGLLVRGYKGKKADRLVTHFASDWQAHLSPPCRIRRIRPHAKRRGSHLFNLPLAEAPAEACPTMGRATQTVPPYGQEKPRYWRVILLRMPPLLTMPIH